MLFLGIELGGPERNPIVLCFARKVILRKIGTIDRRIRVGANHGERSVVAFTPDHFGGRDARRASSDDDNRGGACGRWDRGSSLRRLHLVPDEYPIALALDAPAGNRIERGCAQRLARAQAEARVMQRTPDGVADDESFGERPAVVRAVCPDRKQLAA